MAGFFLFNPSQGYTSTHAFPARGFHPGLFTL